MTAICFVCNLPILSHQVGLVWAGGNGWDELTRSTLEESTLRQRLGSRRDSAAQVSCLSPPEPDVSDQSRGKFIQLKYVDKLFLIFLLRD